MRRSVFTVVFAAAAALGLVACAPTGDPQPTASAPVSAPASATPTGEATAAPAPPAFVPDGTAEQNLAIFTQVTEQVWASDDRAAGRAYVDALAAVGFDKAAMQVTEDYSTVGNAAESMQFSVRLTDACLVGQVGPATGEPVVAILDVLEDRFCLIGATRAIDW